MRPALLAILTGLLLGPSAVAQSLVPSADSSPGSYRDEAGRPFVTCFEPKEYGGDFQTWDFVQDSRGVLYAGNNLGVLEYDGAAWRLIDTGGKVTRSLDVDSADRIFVGSFGDIGFLAPDASGELKFVSLLSYVPEKDRVFNDVWTVHATPDGVYFQARERLFRVRETSEGWDVRVWRPTDRFMYAFWVRETLYVAQSGIGLMKMTEDGLELLPGGALFANDRTQVMLPFEEDGEERLLVGSFSLGLHVFDGRSFTPLRTEIDDILKTTILYKGVLLSDGSFGLLTTEEGFLVIDRSGRLLNRIDRSTGLIGSTIYAAYIDHSGHIWLSPNGICQVEMPSPLSRYTAGQGLQGSVSAVTRHDGLLYASTETGFFYLDRSDNRFMLVDGMLGNRQAFGFLRVDDVLLGATNGGLYEIEGTRARLVREDVAGDFSVLALHRSKVDPSYIFVGLGDGLAIIRRGDAGDWIEERRLDGIYEYITHIIEPEPGVLWIGTIEQSTLRVRYTSEFAISVERFGPDHGLDDSGGISVFQTSGGPLFAARNRILSFDDEQNRFVHEEDFDGLVGFSRSQDEFSIVEDAHQNLWVNFGLESAMLRRGPDGTLSADKTALLRFADSPASTIYPEADGVVWFGGYEGVVRYDPTIQKDYSSSYPVLIRSVTVGDDSLLYGGSGAIDTNSKPRLDFDLNSMRFGFSALSFDNSRANRYRSMLEGFDDHWSPWTSENRRDYTNLPPGDYTFRVQAQNVYGLDGQEATFPLTILAPWYRTWWALLFYVLAGAGLIFGVVRERTRHLQRRQRELEQTVAERTAELKQRVEELAVINSVQEGLVRELDMQAIYELVGERIRDLFDAQVVVIRTYDSKTGMEHPRFGIEKGVRLYPGPSPIDGFHRHLMETRKTLVINSDLLTFVRQFTERVVLEGEIPKSAVFVPMIVGDSVRGSVSLQNVDHENAFSEADVRLLTTLTNSMSVALENARLFDETSRLLGETAQRASELDTVNHISRALVAQLEFDALVQLVGEQMRETFQADIVYVALHDRKTDMLHFPYEHGDHTPSRSFGSGLTEKIITTREPLLINRDLTEVQRQMQAEQIGKVAASYLGVPILVGEEAIGVISVQTAADENRFDDNDLRLLSTIAANVGVALQNADAYRRLNAALENLRATQEQLVHQEKMASLGALTAGIAHEIKNPLNFINNFAALNVEYADELDEELQGAGDRSVEEVRDELHAIVENLRVNARLINQHSKRADGIVRSMMSHASGGAGERRPTDLNTLVAEYVDLAYHGKRAQSPGFNVEIKRDFDASVGAVEIVPHEIGRVVLNLVSNAFDAVHEHSRENGRMEPCVSISTLRREARVEIRVQDSGPGVPAAIRERIFEPFFTTKAPGSGTGLGLSLSYDIVTNGHGGSLSVESVDGEGATFVISLPQAPVKRTVPAR